MNQSWRIVITYFFNSYFVRQLKSIFLSIFCDTNVSLYSVLYFILLAVGLYFWMGLKLFYCFVLDLFGKLSWYEDFWLLFTFTKILWLCLWEKYSLWMTGLEF